MIESISVSIPPVLFLLTLTVGEKLLYRNESVLEDVPPINKRLFLISKYSILLIWAAMILQSWGIHLFIIEAPQLGFRIYTFIYGSIWSGDLF